LRLLAAFVGAAIRCAAGCALLAAAPGRAADEPAATRVEARSESLLAVGIVRADHLVVHVTRVVDNAPVRDAVLTVLLRGRRAPDGCGGGRQLYVANQGPQPAGPGVVGISSH